MRNTRVRHITIWLVTLVRKNVIKRYNRKGWRWIREDLI